MINFAFDPRSLLCDACFTKVEGREFYPDELCDRCREKYLRWANDLLDQVIAEKAGAVDLNEPES